MMPPSPRPSQPPVIEALGSRCLLSSIAGLWQGSRSESGLSGTFANVAINLNLTQSGTLVTGTEIRSSPSDPEYFADILTHGALIGNTFNLHDDSITASKTTSDYTWLLYKATLQLSSDGQTLAGSWHSGGIGGSMTLQRVPLPLITLNSAGTLDHNSVTIHYSIQTADVTEPLRFDIYRSSRNHLVASSQLIGSQTISPRSHAKLLAIGLHRATLIPGTSLTGDKRRPFVIIVVNSDNRVPESAGSINIAVFQLLSF